MQYEDSFVWKSARPGSRLALPAELVEPEDIGLVTVSVPSLVKGRASALLRLPGLRLRPKEQPRTGQFSEFHGKPW